ncbi:adenylyltransferase/cytidyltransferase family protein [Candidatus Kuenenbacteria bacterium]|nr:adenylyltransferase/cytidyltransferase family protein [Candidatus Kuenenbacteria bacterium]
MNKRKNTVMVFGTFDILHQGHKHFLKQAKQYGNFLIVVIARDVTVKQVKGKLPDKNEKQRQQAVIKSNLADKVVLGNLKNKYAVIKKFKPDIICLGYDQEYFVSQLKSEINPAPFLEKRCGVKKFQSEASSRQRTGTAPLVKHIKIIRLKPYKARKYKTSIIKTQNEKRKMRNN